ncbi:cyclase family protein [Nocardia xishanensis]
MCAPRIVRLAHENAARPSRRALFAAAGLTALAAAAPPARAIPAARGVLDLTHTLGPGLPRWPGTPPFTTVPVAWHAIGGFGQNALAYWEHSGTHLDAPAHRVPGGATTDALPVADLVAPLVVIDISSRAERDPDAALTIDDIENWQIKHGRIPERAFVAVHSGWERHIDDAAAFLNLDAEGVPHAPGVSPDAAAYLVQRCGVVGVGVDTLSLDHALSRDHGAHTAILGAGRYGVEMLANLGAAPASGATVVIGAPKHLGGTGGPCRVIALI